MIVELTPRGAQHPDRRTRRIAGATSRARSRASKSSSSSVSSATSAIPSTIELRGSDIDELESMASDISGSARPLSRREGHPRLPPAWQAGAPRLEILPSAEALGLTVEDIARQVRQAFYGAEAQRIQRGRDEVKVMVRYPPEQRRALSDVRLHAHPTGRTARRCRSPPWPPPRSAAARLRCCAAIASEPHQRDGERRRDHRCNARARRGDRADDHAIPDHGGSPERRLGLPGRAEGVAQESMASIGRGFLIACMSRSSS